MSKPHNAPKSLTHKSGKKVSQKHDHNEVHQPIPEPYSSLAELLNLMQDAITRYRNEAVDRAQFIQNARDRAFEKSLSQQRAAIEQKAPSDGLNEEAHLIATRVANQAQLRAEREYIAPALPPFPELHHEPLERLAHGFKLGSFERFVILFGVAASLRGPVSAFCREYAGGENPTPFLAYGLYSRAFENDLTEEGAARLFSPEQQLRAWDLIELQNDEERGSNPYQSAYTVESAIMDHLLSLETFPSTVAPYVRALYDHEAQLIEQERKQRRENHLQRFQKPSKDYPLNAINRLKPTQRAQALELRQTWAQASRLETPRAQWPVLQLVHRLSAVLFETKLEVIHCALSSFVQHFFEFRLDHLPLELTEHTLRLLNREVKLKDFALVVDVSRMIGTPDLEGLVRRFAEGYHGLLILCTRESFEVGRDTTSVNITKANAEEQRGLWVRALARGWRTCRPVTPIIERQFFEEGIPLPEGFQNHVFAPYDDGSAFTPKHRAKFKNHSYQTLFSLKYALHDALYRLVGQYDLDAITLERAAKLALTRYEDWLIPRVLPKAMLTPAFDGETLETRATRHGQAMIQAHRVHRRYLQLRIEHRLELDAVTIEEAAMNDAAATLTEDQAHSQDSSQDSSQGAHLNGLSSSTEADFEVSSEEEGEEITFTTANQATMTSTSTATSSFNPERHEPSTASVATFRIHRWQRRVVGADELDLTEISLRIDTLTKFAWSAVQEIIMPRIGNMAQLLKPKAQWDQLVLPDGEKMMLETLAAHVTRRHQVYSQWGFNDISSYGFGITTLFGGPSGTGKTFAAEVLGTHLGLDLIKVDLSNVVSKYIGETEKNLSKVFDAAESGGAILFFDEGDALFGKRGEVSSSTDRYANVEVAYLLQRMEQFRGLAILTTNLENSLDTAFLRRLRFVIRFKVPEKAERMQIWRRAFPEQTPLGTLNWDAIANWEFSGGNIRNVALNAAFAAANAKYDFERLVIMKHIYNAALMEIRKLKRLPRDEELIGWESFTNRRKEPDQETLAKPSAEPLSDEAQPEDGSSQPPPNAQA